MDFSKFLKDNNLKGCQIAEYLGVSGAFVSQLCKGTAKLPTDKLTLLLSNEKWDCSALNDAGNIAIATGRSIANAGNGSVLMESAKIEILKKEIEMLQKMLDEKDATIEFLKSLINK